MHNYILKKRKYSKKRRYSKNTSSKKRKRTVKKGGSIKSAEELQYQINELIKQRESGKKINNISFNQNTQNTRNTKDTQPNQNQLPQNDHEIDNTLLLVITGFI